MSGPDESIKQPENNLAVSHERTDTTQDLLLYTQQLPITGIFQCPSPKWQR